MLKSGKRRIVVGLLALLVGFAYLVIVDLGIHAGRIHRGVEVEGGVDVGGLTLNEAVEQLGDIGSQIEIFPLIFSSPGFDCRTTPGNLGWRARPFTTAQQAMKVGREDAPFGAFTDRIKAWFGVTVPWTDSPNPRKVGKFVQQCEKLGAGFGVTVDKGRLRFMVKRAIVEWPREQVYGEIPTL